MRYRLKSAVSLLVIASVLASSVPARAQVAVVDVSAIVQAVKEVNNGLAEVAALETELNNEVAMLAALPYSLVPNIEPLLQATQQLMGQLQSIQSKGEALITELNNMYPTNFSGQNLQQMAAKIAQMQATVQTAMQASMQLQNQLAANQPLASQTVKQAVSMSQGAQGMTGVGQATNQMLAAMSQQLSDLQSILAAHERAEEQKELNNISLDAALKQFNASNTSPPAGQSFQGGF